MNNSEALGMANDIHKQYLKKIRNLQSISEYKTVCQSKSYTLSSLML